MTQLSTYTLIYEQVAKSIAKLYEQWKNGEYVTKQDLLNDFNKSLAELYKTAGTVNTTIDQFIKGEPPSSIKFNKFLSSMRDDINISASQLDNLSAKVTDAFNLIKAEIESEKNYSNRIYSKAKVLQLYSESPADDLIYVGDSFDNTDYIDSQKSPLDAKPIVSNGQLSLSIKKRNYWSAGTVLINKSNGFPGNNHVVVRDTNEIEGDNYKYIWEESASIDNRNNIKDQNPLTYFEYEALNVRKNTITPQAIQYTEDEFSYIVDDDTLIDAPKGSLVNWSNHSLSEPLVLDITLSNTGASKTNCIKIVPYFGSSKTVKVSSIVIKVSDGTEQEILDKPVYIGLSPEFLNNESSKNFFLNEATIYFKESEVIECRVKMEQNQYSEVDILHNYWMTDYANDTIIDNSPFAGQIKFDPKAVDEEVYQEVRFDQTSITPKMTNPNIFKSKNITSKNVSVTVISKKPDSNNQTSQTYSVPVKVSRTLMKADRMSIGLRDISLYYDEYSEYAEFISLPFSFDLPVEAVILNVISNEKLISDSVSLVTAEISADGKNFLPIDTVQSGFAETDSSVPEVIAFNQNIPSGYKLPGIAYYSNPTTGIPKEVKQLWVKIKVKKDPYSNTTPVIYSYSLGVKVKKS
jgi:hypothetical protein